MYVLGYGGGIVLTDSETGCYTVDTLLEYSGFGKRGLPGRRETCFQAKGLRRMKQRGDVL